MGQGSSKEVPPPTTGGAGATSAYKQLYSRFLRENEGVLHLACHSHHYWPDVTLEAMQEYWIDTARFVDDKWGHIFSEKVPECQKLIADTLKLSNPESIVFAPNTHELFYRLCSCFYSGKEPLRILSSNSEFHSFHRQSHRFEEEGKAAVTRIEVTDAFETDFIKEALSGKYDMIFLSQVFFDSGIPCRLGEILDQISSTDSTIVVDGYHGFFALPTDLREYESRIFYLGGSYKYAQGGEGCCWMHCPPNDLKPVNTGWYAGFADLEGARSGQVSFPQGAMKFAGATMDMSPLYRLIASLKMHQDNGLTVEKVHAQVQRLQHAFLERIDALELSFLARTNLLHRDLSNHGHFLTFKMGSPTLAASVHTYLKKHKIITDVRNDRLRFGFAIYHDPADYHKLAVLKEFPMPEAASSGS